MCTSTCQWWAGNGFGAGSVIWRICPCLWRWGMLAPLPVLACGDSADNMPEPDNPSQGWRWNSLAVMKMNMWMGNRKMKCHNIHQLLLWITYPLVLLVRDWCTSDKIQRGQKISSDIEGELWWWQSGIFCIKNVCVKLAQQLISYSVFSLQPKKSRCNRQRIQPSDNLQQKLATGYQTSWHTTADPTSRWVFKHCEVAAARTESSGAHSRASPTEKKLPMHPWQRAALIRRHAE